MKILAFFFVIAGSMCPAPAGFALDSPVGTPAAVNRIECPKQADPTFTSSVHNFTDQPVRVIVEQVAVRSQADASQVYTCSQPCSSSTKTIALAPFGSADLRLQCRNATARDPQVAYWVRVRDANSRAVLSSESCGCYAADVAHPAQGFKRRP